jgi:hypothetical protein
MLTSFEGLYRNGQIKIADLPTGIPDGTRVIVTFLNSGELDLESLGINKIQAQILRSSLVTFAEEWDSPEMSIYDHYDAAKKH